MSRKNAIAAAFSAGAAGVLLSSAPVLAEEAAAPATAPAAAGDGPPTDWGLTKQYYPVSVFVALCCICLWLRLHLLITERRQLYEYITQ